MINFDCFCFAYVNGYTCCFSISVLCSNTFWVLWLKVDLFDLLPFTDISWCVRSEETLLGVTCKWPYVPSNENGDCKTTDLFTTTFSSYLLRFFTVNYTLRLNLTILRLNKDRFFSKFVCTERDIPWLITPRDIIFNPLDISSPLW